MEVGGTEDLGGGGRAQETNKNIYCWADIPDLEGVCRSQLKWKCDQEEDLMA